MALSLPSLPTDNLYKFAALSGVALIIFAFYLTFSQLWSVRSHLTDAEESIQLAVAHRDMAFEKKDKWQKLLVDAKIKKDQGKLDVESEGEIKTAEQSLTRAEDDLRLEMIKLTFAAKRTTNEWIWLLGGIVLCAGAVVMGSWMARWGFQNWYLRIQLPMDAQVLKSWKSDKSADDQEQTPAGEEDG